MGAICSCISKDISWFLQPYILLYIVSIPLGSYLPQNTEKVPSVVQSLGVCWYLWFPLQGQLERPSAGVYVNWTLSCSTICYNPEHKHLSVISLGICSQ